MIELRAPDTKVKLVTPMIIKKTQNSHSNEVLGAISPYPTVAVVVTTK